MDNQEWADRNPFTNQYVREEADFYNLKDYDQDGIVLTSGSPMGVLDDYLNRHFATGKLLVPVLRIDGVLWMSLTRMECQSQHLPILYSNGNVGTVGLGLGHYALRTMAKPSVTKLTVFEKDERIINFFTNSFSNREGFNKLEIIHGDGRETCQGYEFDFLYVDIYPTCLGDEVISDIELFMSENIFYNWPLDYHFWGIERVLLEAINENILSSEDLPLPFIKYINQWLSTKVEGIQGDYTLSGLHHPMVDNEYINLVIEKLGI